MNVLDLLPRPRLCLDGARLQLRRCLALSSLGARVRRSAYSSPDRFACCVWTTSGSSFVIAGSAVTTMLVRRLLPVPDRSSGAHTRSIRGTCLSTFPLQPAVFLTPARTASLLRRGCTLSSLTMNCWKASSTASGCCLVMPWSACGRQTDGQGRKPETNHLGQRQGRRRLLPLHGCGSQTRHHEFMSGRVRP